jgi:hypothetical protein
MKFVLLRWIYHTTSSTTDLHPSHSRPSALALASSALLRTSDLCGPAPRSPPMVAHYRRAMCYKHTSAHRQRPPCPHTKPLRRRSPPATTLELILLYTQLPCSRTLANQPRWNGKQGGKRNYVACDIRTNCHWTVLLDQTRSSCSDGWDWSARSIKPTTPVCFLALW